MHGVVRTERAGAAAAFLDPRGGSFICKPAVFIGGTKRWRQLQRVAAQHSALLFWAFSLAR